MNHWAIARHFVLWVAFYLDMFGPEKNAVLSSGVGSDEARPLCWCCQGMLIMDCLAAFSFTAVRRCRPGVRCCSGRCGYDRGMGRKALRAKDLWVIWSLQGERSGMRDLSLLVLSSYLRQTLNCATMEMMCYYDTRENKSMGEFKYWFLFNFTLRYPYKF